MDDNMNSIKAKSRGKNCVELSLGRIRCLISYGRLMGVISAEGFPYMGPSPSPTTTRHVHKWLHENFYNLNEHGDWPIKCDQEGLYFLVSQEMEVLVNNRNKLATYTMVELPQVIGEGPQW